MKAIVIYYSLSGNTRKIAQAIHKGMAQLADQCDIVAVKGARGIPGMRMGHLLEYDLIGIGSPVWRSMMTPNVMDFIYHMPTQEFQAITEGVHFRIKHFYGVKIIEEKCVKCGICEDNCPMDAIDLDADEPILPTCIWCTACDMVCPVCAIDLNMAELKKDRGENEEELREGGRIQTEKFMEEQKQLRPEKRMRWHIDPKDVLLKGYISDITDNPRVVIPEQGWRQVKKQ